VKLTLPGQPRTVNDCMLAEGFVNVYYGGTKSKPPMTNALPLTIQTLLNKPEYPEYILRCA
jgi:hypothetical protein